MADKRRHRACLAELCPVRKLAVWLIQGFISRQLQALLPTTVSILTALRLAHCGHQRPCTSFQSTADALGDGTSQSRLSRGLKGSGVSWHGWVPHPQLENVARGDIMVVEKVVVRLANCQQQP